jgi:hypothetical protein
MNISEHLTKKNLLWLAGTLLLGALGSGLWEAAVKPSMLWFGTLMLDVATLGLSSLRDGMYLDVAKGTYERAGVMLLAMATGILCGFLTAPIAVGRILRKRDEDGRPNSATARILSKNWLLATFALAFTMIFFVSFFRISYIVRASNYADQLARVTAPYVSERDRLMIQSELAQVETREDYVRLVYKLRKIASENDASVPDFAIY